MWKAIGITFLVIFLAFGIYVNDYYHTDTEAVAEFLAESSVERRELDNGNIAYVPEGATAGVIFYPGGKVEYTAYEPLMKALADRGILSVLIKMPFNLAILKENAADGVREQFEGIDSWYMAGHSLGGTSAAFYADKNSDGFDGMIFLASYTTVNMSDSGLRVLSVYGSEDGVLNKDKYEKNKSKLPSDFTELVIDGANHAGFGMYGAQKKDGEATLTNTEQITKTADAIADFIE